MKPDLVKAASEVITNQHILVNMVSRRVRQLALGHRPLVEYAPGLGAADIALSEIANKRSQSLAQMALAWVLRQPCMTSVLIGASRVEQIEQNVAALQRLVFSGEELAAIEKVLGQ